MRTWTLGEFDSPEDAEGAARALGEEGAGEVDTYSGFPLHGGAKALGLGRSRVPPLALAGGLLGAATGYSIQWFCNAVDFPINVGNRPPHAPLSFIPITFELTILFASLFIFFGLLALARLPRPHHPVFEATGFETVGSDKFWVSVSSSGDDGRAGEVLRALGALRVERVTEQTR
jgi:hypothetical protein